MITQNPFTGKSRGSLANVTATSMFGKNVLKSKPITVANPRSVGQVTQRGKLANGVVVFRQIADAVNLGFKERAVGMSAYNAFMKKNLELGVFSPTYPNHDPVDLRADLKVSDGSIGASEIKSCTSTSATAISIQLENTVPVGSSTTDKAVLVALVNDSGQLFVSSSKTNTRAQLIAVATAFNFPASAGVDSGNVDCYLFFVNSVTGKVSIQEYATYSV